MVRFCSTAVAAALVALTASCAILKSEMVSQSNTIHGLVYSLPMGQFQLAASRTRVSPLDLAKAQATITQINQALAKDAQAVAVAAGDDAKMTVAKAAQAADKAALDAATTSAEILKANQGKWQETVSLVLLPIAPDPRARYVTDLDHEGTRDDTLKLSVVNGLLTSTALTTVDQTPNIIVQTADTVITALAEVGKIAPAAPPVGPPAPIEKPEEEARCGYSLSRVFNPLNNKELNDLTTDLQKQGAGFKVHVPAAEEAENQPVAQGLKEEELSVDGIVYRVATPVVVNIVPNTESTNQCKPVTPLAAQSISAIIPDTRSRFFVSAKAGPFTTTNLNFGFSSGLLTDFASSRPSEIAAIAGVPVTIADHIMEIPAKILQLRINYDTQETALVNAQTALRKAQIDQTATLTAAMTAVVNAQAALGEAQINEPTTLIKARTALVQAQVALQKAIQTAAFPPSVTSAK